MNAKKTVLAVLVISLFVFYIVCTLIIQSQKQELKAIESRLSSYRQHSYHQTEATARTTQSPPQPPLLALRHSTDLQGGKSIPVPAQTAFTIRRTSTSGT